jgi:hypothetical protein
VPSSRKKREVKKARRVRDQKIKRKESATITVGKAILQLITI